MLDKELSKLIHESVSETFTKNKMEFLPEYRALISSLDSSGKKPSKEIDDALFNYTLRVSELNCAAMAKILASAGILTIFPSKR